MAKLKFTKTTLDSLLEEIIEVYFEDDSHMTFAESIEYVKDAYKDEIETLEDGPTWIVGVDLSI